MILTAHQPVYLPWLGLLHKIYLADVFCIFDIAQYQTKDFNNRNKIKTQSGPIWLSVPVESKNHFEKSVGEIKVVANGWNKKHFKSIDLAYRKAPYYKDYIGTVEELLLKRTWDRLADLNWAFLEFFLEQVGIERPIHRASDYQFEGKKSDLVQSMCQTLGATHYIFGAQGKDYADVDSFHRAGIELTFQDYKHPVYRQLHDEFEPYMSAIDLLFNEGPASLEIILSGNIRSVEKDGVRSDQ